MPPHVCRFTFELPYYINIADGQISTCLILPLPKYGGTLRIHPPKVSEKGLINNTIVEIPEKGKRIWRANAVDIDVELTSVGPPDELINQLKPVVESYLKRFLTRCRARTKQFQIDLRDDIEASDIVYMDDKGQEFRQGYLNVKMILGEPPSLDDNSWYTIQKDLLDDVKTPFYEGLLLDAKLYRGKSDYRMSAISAAMAIETILSEYIRRKLSDRLRDTGGASDDKVDNFIEEAIERLQASVAVNIGLGLSSTIKLELLERCRKSLNIRNKIIHLKLKSEVTMKNANQIIATVEALLSNEEICRTLMKDSIEDERGRMNSLKEINGSLNFDTSI